MWIFQKLDHSDSYAYSSDILSSVKDNHVESLSKQVTKKLNGSLLWYNISSLKHCYDDLHDILTLQIATLEMKSVNEKERADHADSRYKLLQSQNNQIEKVINDENQNDEMFNYAW